MTDFSIFFKFITQFSYFYNFLWLKSHLHDSLAEAVQVLLLLSDI